jgi:PAS domain S-box-containing protein
VARLRDSLGLDSGTFFEVPKEESKVTEHVIPGSVPLDKGDAAPSAAGGQPTRGGSETRMANIPTALGLSNDDLHRYLVQLRQGELINPPGLSESAVDGLQNGSPAKSVLAIPVSAGGLTCALVFSTWKAERQWPDELVSRLRIVGEIFTSALARWRVQAALRKSEEHYRNVVETQTELICRYLADTTLTFVNDAYCRYFGRRRDQLMGTKFIEFVPEAARAATLEYISAVMARARADSREHQVLRPDGSTGWQQWTDHAIVGPDGRVVEIQGIGRDVTKRRLAEQAAHTTQELLQSTIDALEVQIAILDEEATIIAVNEPWRRFAGAKGLAGESCRVGELSGNLSEEYSPGSSHFAFARNCRHDAR